MRDGRVREIAAGVFCVGGTDVNWVLVRDGGDLTLIDAGWPGDRAALERSVRAIGHRLPDIRAVLLTHAHIDHVGSVSELHERLGTPVYAGAAESARVRSGRQEQASVRDVAVRAWRPRVLAWSARIVRAGALREPRLPDVRPFPSGGPLDLPGRPVPVPCPGHTSGHCAYLLPGHGVVATGDALVTGHPLSRVRGPQMLPAFFSHAPGQEPAGLARLADLPADTIAPGHGEPWRGDLATAVADARERARP